MNKDKENRETDDNGLDDLFRKGIIGSRVEPPPGVWKGISRKLLWQEVRHFNFSNLSLKYWLSGALVALIGGLATYVLLPDLSAVEKTQLTSNQELPAVERSQTTKERTVLDIRNPDGPDHANVGSGSKNAKSINPAPVSSEQIDLSEHKNFRDTKTDLIVSESQGGTDESGISFMDPLEIEQIDATPFTDTLITISTYAGESQFLVKQNRASQMFSASFGINPELAIYRSPEAYRKMNYWTQLGFSWHISRFSITSGIGLGYMFDEGKYRVEYKSLDSVGFYSNVVSYSTGSNNEITYTTETFTLYDSLVHLNDSRTTNRYTYLRIPMLFGYRLFDSDRFSITMQAGPAVSVLLGSRKSDPEIEYSNARIIRIDEETPSRLKSNWQVWANLYFEMYVTQKISLYLEPSFKYYLSPTAEQENPGATPPWSVGLGVGLQFNFEHKKQKP